MLLPREPQEGQGPGSPPHAPPRPVRGQAGSDKNVLASLPSSLPFLSLFLGPLGHPGGAALSPSWDERPWGGECGCAWRAGEMTRQRGTDGDRGQEGTVGGEQRQPRSPPWDFHTEDRGRFLSRSPQTRPGARDASEKAHAPRHDTAWPAVRPRGRVY